MGGRQMMSMIIEVEDSEGMKDIERAWRNMGLLERDRERERAVYSWSRINVDAVTSTYLFFSSH